jgi:FkbM family methyltransferase
MSEPYGARVPGWLDRKVLAATSCLPNNWFGLRIAIALRRIVIERLADDNGLDVVRWGLQLRLHPLHNGCEKGALFTPQMYETPERKELVAEIKKSKAAGKAFQFIDIGANVGLFSLFVASCAGSNANILAIEPEPENIRRLQFNIAANPDIAIRVIALALGEKAGSVVLEIDRRDKGGTRARPLNHDEQGSVNVQCRPLLDVLRQEGVSRIDALKIDVEGMEDTILIPFFKDADVSLWPNLILIEDARDSWRSDLFSFLAERGYTVVRRSRQNLMLRRLAV